MRVYLEYLRDHLTIPPVALYSRHSMKDSPVWFQVIRYEEDIEFEPQFMLFGRGDRWQES